VLFQKAGLTGTASNDGGERSPNHPSPKDGTDAVIERRN
jgi:hypothetical protein